MIRQARLCCGSTVLLAVLAAPLSAAPGTEATAQGVATARVVAPLKLDTIAPLEFGTIVASQAGSGTVTVDPSGGAPVYTGALRGLCGGSAGCHATPARFAVTGEAGRFYRVEYPREALAYAVAAAAPALRVMRLAIGTDSLPGGSARGQLGSGGADSFRIGGTLEVPAGTIAGTYRARLDVLVAYD